jgi:hypothetical protein
MKKPKLPAHVLIGNVRYQIEDLPFDKVRQGVNGDCSNVLHHKIRIDPELVGEEAIDTLFHEIFHAMVDIYRINLSHKQIYQLSSALAQLVRYNPHIPNWMEKIEAYSEFKMENEE